MLAQATTADPNPQVTAVFRRTSNTTTSRVAAATSVTAPSGLPPGCASSLGASGNHGVVPRDPAGYEYGYE